MELIHQCANNACSCKVQSEGNFCSETCRKQANNPDQSLDTCDCQHVDCGAAHPEDKRGKDVDVSVTDLT